MTQCESLFGSGAVISQYLRSLWVVCESISGLRPAPGPAPTGYMLGSFMANATVVDGYLPTYRHVRKILASYTTYLIFFACRLVFLFFQSTLVGIGFLSNRNHKKLKTKSVRCLPASAAVRGSPPIFCG